MPETSNRSERLLRYTLGPADSLAFAILRHELTGWQKLRLLVIVGLSGLATGMLPTDIGAVYWWAAVAAILGIGAAGAILWSNLEVRRKAARLGIPGGAIELCDLGDRLSERSAQGVREVKVEDVAQVVATAGHVFIRVGVRPLVIPASAFADRADMMAFAAHWDEASRAAAS